MDAIPLTLHTQQMFILTYLMFCKEARFTDINTQHLSSDQLSYHLKKLVGYGLITKTNDELYTLTSYGSVYVGKIDHFTAVMELQPVVVVMAVCHRIYKGKQQYLIQRRTKHPDYGFYSVPEGKVKYGETLEDAVLRELHEETGLTGIPVLKQTKHVLKSLPGSEDIIKDNIFYIFRIDALTGELKQTKEGENIWMTLDEYSALDRKYEDNIRSLISIHKDGIDYFELTTTIH